MNEQDDVHDAASGANVINSSTLQVQDISGPGTADTANEEEVCDATSWANVDSSTLQVKDSSVVHDASENQVIEEKSQSTQVTASEALAFICNSEADTQKNDDGEVLMNNSTDDGLASNVINTETNAKEHSSASEMKKTDEDDGQSTDVLRMLQHFQQNLNMQTNELMVTRQKQFRMTQTTMLLMMVKS